MFSPKFYAACLDSYNNGILHGAWIDAESDVDSMQEAVAEMLAKSPMKGAEEWQIHDWDDDSGALSPLGETSDLDTIAQRVEALEEIESDYDESVIPTLLSWIAERQDNPDFWASDLSDAFLGTYRDAEDYAAEMTDESNIPEHILGYVDFKAMARDWSLSGEVDFICVHTGSTLQDYDSMVGRECIVLANR